jgi:hypothetical protein
MKSPYYYFLLLDGIPRKKYMKAKQLFCLYVFSNYFFISYMMHTQFLGKRLSYFQFVRFHACVSNTNQNPKIHYRVLNSSPRAPILSQLKVLHIPACFSKIHSDPILPSTFQFSERSLSFGLSI